MSNVTLSPAILNALLAPVGKSLPTAIDTDLLTFAHAVKTLEESGRMDFLINAFAPKEPATIAPEAGFNADPSIAQRASKPAKAPKRGRKPEIKAEKPVKSADTLPNFEGKLMLCGEGTASKGQQKWLTENTDMSAADIKTISMVDASNWRAYSTGKITAAQYNRLP